MARSRQQRLPGTENANRDLEDLAHKYVEARDERMRHLQTEVELKNQMLAYMHKHNLLTYKYQDVSVERVEGKETLKVTVAKSTPEKGELAK